MKILKFCSCFGVELYIYFENHGVAEMIHTLLLIDLKMKN